MKTYVPTIGIEVHAELNTKSKMFCGCANDPHSAKPNTNICPVCLAHPGTLPTVNKSAVESILKVGVAINGSIASYSEFDRKNYFYPDIPKAYQISQYAFPFVSGGELGGVAITRVHLEEDTARSQHEGTTSVVDFNRAGVPLMELVTEPVIHDSKTAGMFAKELQLLLRTLGVSDANMERGEMRVEANISISSDPEILGTKVEVKNLNSFRSMMSAIEYEISRQTEILNENKAVLSETRGWDEDKECTFSQRVKETSDDYRYFPDPDIPKFDISQIDTYSEAHLRKELPELPQKTREYLRSFGIAEDRIGLLIADFALLEFFKACVAELGKNAGSDVVQIAFNYLTSDILGLLQNNTELELSTKNAKHFAQLVNMVSSDTISSRVAKDMLLVVVFEGNDPQIYAQKHGLLQNNSKEELRVVVEQVIAENPSVCAEYKGGKESVLQFLVGQAMKATKGSAKPQVLQELFKDSLQS